MIAKIADNMYIDVDLISSIFGYYDSENEDEWNTLYTIEGIECEIEGRVGRNIMDSYEWKWKHSIIDMVPGSPKYKRNTKGEK